MHESVVITCDFVIHNPFTIPLKGRWWTLIVNNHVVYVFHFSFGRGRGVCGGVVEGVGVADEACAAGQEAYDDGVVRHGGDDIPQHLSVGVDGLAVRVDVVRDEYALERYQLFKCIGHSYFMMLYTFD